MLFYQKQNVGGLSAEPWTRSKLAGAVAGAAGSADSQPLPAAFTAYATQLACRAQNALPEERDRLVLIYYSYIFVDIAWTLKKNIAQYQYIGHNWNDCPFANIEIYALSLHSFLSLNLSLYHLTQLSTFNIQAPITIKNFGLQIIDLFVILLTPPVLFMPLFLPNSYFFGICYILILVCRPFGICSSSRNTFK